MRSERLNPEDGRDESMVRDGSASLPVAIWQVLRTRAALVLLITSVIVRVFYTTWAELPYKDGVGYDSLAHGLLTSGTYGTPEAWAPKSPGYPFFLAGVYAVFGERHSALFAIQHLIDLGTAVLVVAIAMEWGLTRHRALLAFGIALFNPFTLVFASLVLSETLAIFLMTFALWLAIHGPTLSLRRLLLFGATMSVVALIRPAFAAVAPAILVGSWVVRRGTFSVWLRGALVAGVAFLLVWAPWGVRNVTRFHRVVPYHVGNEQGHPGYSAWCYTWVTNMLDVYGAFWEKPTVLPSHAFSTPAERAEVESLLLKKEQLGPTVDPHDPTAEAIEQRFAELANARRAREPVTFWLVLPAKRAFTLWFTRETTVLAQGNVRMGELRGAIRSRPLALGAKLSLFALMPLFPLTMLLGAISLLRTKRKSVLLPISGGLTVTAIIEYLMLFKPAYLVVMEPRYVIEFFPALTPAVVVGIFALPGLARNGWALVRGGIQGRRRAASVVGPELRERVDAADSQR